jgi:hypothetical protein
MWTPPEDEIVKTASAWTPPADERVDAPAQPEKSVGGLMSNAVSDAGQMASGLGTAVMHPIDTTKNVATHLPEIGHAMAHSWGLDTQDAGHRMETLKNEAYEHPVSHLLDAASLAFPAAKALGIGDKALEAGNIAGKAGRAADSLEHTADIMRAKDLGARTKAFSQVSEEEAARLGRRAKEMGVEGSTKDQLAKAKAIDAETGKRVSELRQVGDMTGASPEFPGLMEQIEKEIGPKYRDGLESGQAGELDKAKAELMKAQPVKKVTPGEESDFAHQDATREGFRDADPTGAMGHKGEFPENSYEDFRRGQEEEIPNYDVAANPNTSALAAKSTAMNRFAAEQQGLLRPSGPSADVANLVSNKNDSHLAQMLGSDKAKEYVDALSKESDAKDMQMLLKQKRDRELGSSHAPGSVTSKVIHAAQDRFGYALSAKALDKLAGIVRASPQVLGKYGPALVNLGPAALATTAHVLMQKDPAFAETLQKAGISQ